MKNFASKEKRPSSAARKARPYVHHPMGPAQQAQQAEIRRILRSTGAQAKLTIGQPNNKYEQEADRVADQVMRMPEPKVQRQINSEEIEKVRCSPKASTNDIRLIVRNGTAGTASPLPHLDQIQRSFGPQHDLSGVNAYVEGQAAEAAQHMDAEAYASGERVAFRATPSLHTAAHEAVHVIQQRSGIQISGGVGIKGDVYERNADAVADSVVAGRSCEDLVGAYAGTAGSRPFSSPVIQCLAQSFPYVGPVLSYLNPRNQLTRIILPGLSQPQKTLLDGIFGNSLATSLIRLNPNSILATGHCYRTTGNIINMPGETISGSLLIHEAAHVWQSQNTIFGVGYAVSALKAMAIAQILGGDWQRAYDYRNVERYRIPWRYWNAEQQADWIQDNRCLPSGWMLQALLPDFGVESTGLE